MVESSPCSIVDREMESSPVMAVLRLLDRSRALDVHQQLRSWDSSGRSCVVDANSGMRR